MAIWQPDRQGDRPPDAKTRLPVRLIAASALKRQRGIETVLLLHILRFLHCCSLILPSVDDTNISNFDNETLYIGNLCYDVAVVNNSKSIEI